MFWVRVKLYYANLYYTAVKSRTITATNHCAVCHAFIHEVVHVVVLYVDRTADQYLRQQCRPPRLHRPTDLSVLVSHLSVQSFQHLQQ